MSASPHEDEADYRQAGESARAWEAFCCYRDMGPARSVAKVAQKLGKSESIIGRWSSRHRWVLRVVAWQKDEDSRTAQARQEEARLANQPHLSLARSMLVGLKGCIEQAIADGKLQPKDIAAWLKVAVQIERDALGMEQPVQKIHQSVESEVTFHRDPTGCLPDQVLEEVHASMTSDDWQAAAHAILEARRKKLEARLNQGATDTGTTDAETKP